MKVFKYNEYIKEELHDTPESYVGTALNKLKRKWIKYLMWRKMRNQTGF